MLNNVLVGLFELQVGLTIKVLGLHVALALGVRGAQNENVRWNGLIIVNSHDVSHLDVSPSLLHHALTWYMHQSLGIVL